MALCAFFSIKTISSVSATENGSEGFKKVLFKIEVDKDILDNPALVSVWSQYGKLKVKWKTEIFRTEFPNESIYRPTFKEEYECRLHLAEQWEKLKESNPQFSDRYLDNLVKVKNSHFLKEYVYSYFKKKEWEVDKDKFFLDEFKKWRKNNLKGPKKETHIKLTRIELTEW